MINAKARGSLERNQTTKSKQNDYIEEMEPLPGNLKGKGSASTPNLHGTSKRYEANIAEAKNYLQTLNAAPLSTNFVKQNIEKIQKEGQDHSASNDLQQILDFIEKTKRRIGTYQEALGKDENNDGVVEEDIIRYC
mmetsp:Transcript_44763/g.43348  ORF Transcript_44763/g.43348 Transcript_44763/m.43348 type:complete len:136 (-) Transcript_44763:1395-1802(-)